MNSERVAELAAKYPGIYNVDNCTFTENSGIWLPNLPCSGHGVCMNGTCVCDEGYWGSNDFFNLDGLACHAKKQDEQIFYSIGILVTTIFCLKLLQAANHKRTAFNAIRQRSRARLKTPWLLDAMTFFPFKVLVPNGIFSFIFFILYFALKISYPVSLGNDISVTLALYTAAIPGFFSISETGLEQFTKLTKGSLSKSKKGKDVVKLFRRIVRSSEAFYLLGRLFVLLGILIPDKPFSPLTIPVMIIANAWLLTYYLLFGMGQAIVTRKLSGMLNEISTAISNEVNSSDAGVAPSSSKNYKLFKALNFMKKSSKATATAVVAMAILMSFFLHPMGWPYQNYLPGCAVILSASPNIKHAKSFLPHGKSEASTTMRRTDQVGVAASSTGTDVETMDPVTSSFSNKVSPVE